MSRPASIRLKASRSSPPMRGERGATLVEYAFILILFLSIMFGVGGFGHALYIYHAVNNAAKEGTRWAVVNGYTCPDDGSCATAASTSDIQTYVTNRLPASVDPSRAVVSASFTAPAANNPPPVCTNSVTLVSGVTGGPYANYPGCSVKVTVSYPYNFVFPLLPVTTSTTAPCTNPGWCISSTSEMVIVH